MAHLFAVTITALSMMLGGLFWGWVVMKLLGEKAAKAAIAVAALIAMAKLDFQEQADATWGMLLGLAFLLAAVFRPDIQAAVLRLRATKSPSPGSPERPPR